jgi:hypothetical protein
MPFKAFFTAMAAIRVYTIKIDYKMNIH